jgi:glycine/D-amino acid oxidase-like deaminating enzyme
MTRSSFDDVVVGNGLLGAAAALELVRLGRRVCLVGARHGATGRWFSAHFDDSRMLRLQHTDGYWEAMTRLNLLLIRELKPQSEVSFLTPVVVRLRASVSTGKALAARQRRSLGNDLLHALELEDEAGGIIDPLAYIAAMNAQAKVLGLVQHQAAVLGVSEVGGHCQVETDRSTFTAARVLHASGFHAAETLTGLQVVGKVLLFARRPHAAAGPKECFVDTQPGTVAFSDVYGFCDYRWVPQGAVTKLGFSEVQPVLLEPSQIPGWFSGGWRRHPLLADMLAWVRDWHPGFDPQFQAHPCAFSVTHDGRPALWRSGAQYWLAGCNGMAAKCCQALARAALAALEPALWTAVPPELRMAPVPHHA